MNNFSLASDRKGLLPLISMNLEMDVNIKGTVFKSEHAQIMQNLAKECFSQFFTLQPKGPHSFSCNYPKETFNTVFEILAAIQSRLLLVKNDNTPLTDQEKREYLPIPARHLIKIPKAMILKAHDIQTLYLDMSRYDCCRLSLCFDNKKSGIVLNSIMFFVRTVEELDQLSSEINRLKDQVFYIPIDPKISSAWNDRDYELRHGAEAAAVAEKKKGEEHELGAAAGAGAGP